MSTAIKLGLSEKQMLIRQTGVGASEIAAVAGLVPGGVAVWERKVGLAPEFEGNSLTEFGHRIERVLGEAWKDRHPGKDIFTPGTLRHPRVTVALASLDRVVVPVGRRARETWEEGLEMKVLFHGAGRVGESGTDEVPEQFIAQAQFQMEVADLPRVTIVALAAGDYREFPIARDREFGGMLLEAAQKWWTDYVITNTPPPPDGSDAYGDFLRRKFQRNLGPALQPDPLLESLVTNFRQAKAEADRAEKVAAAAKQALQAAIGDAEGIAGLCSWRNNKDSTKVDWEAFALACNRPDLQPKFVVTSPGARVLRLTTSKEK